MGAEEDAVGGCLGTAGMTVGGVAMDWVPLGGVCGVLSVIVVWESGCGGGGALTGALVGAVVGV